jgi:hypothetical protein
MTRVRVWLMARGIEADRRRVQRYVDAHRLVQQRQCRKEGAS